MEYLQAITLGIVQGITEFLPISSSGHLVIIPKVMGWEDKGLFFDVILHAGSLLALLLVFWNDILDIIKGLFKSGLNKEKQLALGLVVAMVPAIILGLLLGDMIDSTLRSLFWVGLFLMLVGGVFVVSERRFKNKPTKTQPSWKEALWIGLSQAFALFPGVSRSGSTTWMGTRLGLSHVEAARFSFLLGMIAIFAALVKTSADIVVGDESLSVDMGVLLVGFAASALVSFFAIRWLLNFYRKHTLEPFGWYLLGIGTVVLAVYLLE